MRIDLPAPVLALIDSGRGALASVPLQHRQPTDIPRETLVEYALRHGMAAWLPEPIASDAVREQMAWSLDALAQLLAILDLFERHAVGVVVLKGPAFSQWLYGDPAARRFSDLDLLVSPTDRESARRLLERAGYTRRIPGAAGDVVYAALGAWPMVHARHVDVDLHWRLAGRRFSRVLEAGEVLRDAIEISLGERLIRVPRPEHAAILTLMHAAKHLWYALELSFSVAALVRRREVDWNEVRAIAVRAGALRGAAAGLALASELFAVDVPLSFRDDLALADVRALTRGALTVLALPPGVFADSRLERRMHVLAFDRTIDRRLYDVRRALEPTRAEWEWVALPSALAPLYWPARLVRVALLATHAGGGRRRMRL